MFIAGVDLKVAKARLGTTQMFRSSGALFLFKEAAWGYKHFVPTARREHDALVPFVCHHHVAKPGAL
jgi:hypothetical protein